MISNYLVKKLFSEEKAAIFTNLLVSRFTQLTILDLSLNRLPESALYFFLPLLTSENFKYLDVHINSGADSLNAIRILAERIGFDNEAGTNVLTTEKQKEIFKKIIWLPEESLCSPPPIPSCYVEAHKSYYEQRRQISSWELPS